MSNDTLIPSDDDSTSENKMNKTLLNSMYRRRMSCPAGVQQLWDAVKVIRYQRQVANTERIAKYMSRAHSTSQEEVTRQLNYCLRDGLLQIIKKKGSKGSKVGVEQEGYKLPESPAERDRHDWYCFECHTGGDVIFCSGCHRVYHMSCITNLTGSKAKYLCTVCIMCDKPEVLDVKIKRLNRLIALTCNMLKDRYSYLVNSSDMLHRSINIGSPGAQLDIGEEVWRIKFLIHKTMDINKMMSKARDRQYSHLGQFIADARTIVHNVVIFHGVHSDMADDARRMLRDCQSEVADMRCCQQCYHSSHAKTNKHWFCRPCVPPHSLVYARSTPSSPYWPAKVMLIQGDLYEVRFFGSSHERASVNKANILPITTSPASLQVARSTSWTKACEELKRHQDLVAKGPPSDSSSSSEDEEYYKPKVKPQSKATSRESESKFSDRWPEDEDSNMPSTDLSEGGRDERLSGVGGGEEEEEEDEDDEPLAKRGRRLRETSEPERPAPGPPTTPASDQPIKRRRGRPPKNRDPASQPVTPLKRPSKPRVTPTGPPKRRGRPPGSLNKKKKVVKEVKKEKEGEEQGEQEQESVGEKELKEEEGASGGAGEEGGSSTSAPHTPRRPESPSSTGPTPFDIKKNEEEIVSSSCTEPQFRSVAIQTKLSSSVVQQLEEELEELKSTHAEQMKQLQTVHLQEITLTKKKQWCYNCEQEAIYHCCWNTAYCSTECQQIHWQREHKRVCRRKR